MKRTKKIRKVMFFILAGIFMLSIAASCNVKPNLAQFVDGALAEINLGESIVLEEYIVRVQNASYTLTVKKPDGTESNITGATWEPQEPGVYVLNYTVTLDNKSGSAKFTLTVKAPRANWTYTRPGLIYEFGDYVNFADLISQMNISVNSYFDYDIYIKSVLVDGNVTSLVGQSQYRIQSQSEHTFTVECKTEDNQIFSTTLRARVRYTDAQTKSWMDENGIFTYKYVAINSDKSIVLDEGGLTGGMNRGQLASTDIPYVAFYKDGGYGLNTFMEFEFVGKNMPQVAYFVDNPGTGSLVDGGTGIYISNGVTRITGGAFTTADNMRLTVFGPNKVEYREFDDKGRIYNTTEKEGDTPHPMSLLALNDTTNYRYIVGFTNGVEGDGVNTFGSVVMHLLLINLDTGAEVFRLERLLEGSKTTGGPRNMGEGFFDNKYIVAYGRPGKVMTFKITEPFENVANVDEIDVKAIFKQNAVDRVVANQVLNVSDYIIYPQEGSTYKIEYSYDNGIPVLITDDTFIFGQLGEYSLIYTVTNAAGRSKTSTMKIQSVSAKINLIEINNTMYFRKGESLVFADLLNSISYEVITSTGKLYDGLSVKSIGFVSGTSVINVTNVQQGQTSYTFDNEGEYQIVLEGVYGSATVGFNLNAYVLAAHNINLQTRNYLNQNGFSLYGVKEIKSGNVITLNGGTRSANSSSNIGSTDIPYVAFNGIYGLGTFVEFDFTGKNMPQLAFFCDNITKDITDGTRGLFLSNGFLNNAGTGAFNSTEYIRFTVFGPNLLSSKNITQNLTARTNQQAAAISHGNLADGTNYRYIIGFVLRDSDNRILLSAKVINLDTGDAIYNESFTLPTSFTEEMATGKIVAYSKINAETTFSVRLAETGKANATEVDLKGFKSGAPILVLKGEQLSVADYIDTAYGESYTLKYKKTDESNFTTISGSSFSVSQSGSYTLYYTVLKDGRSRLHTLNIETKTASFNLISSPDNLISGLNSQIVFGELINSLSYQLISEDPAIEVKILSISYNDNGVQIIDAKTLSSYTFTKTGIYTFEVGIISDGIKQSGTFTINVIEVFNQATYEWLQANNFSLYGVKEIKPGNIITLNAGTRSGNSSSNIGITDIPYVAFNGIYGLGTFVEFDFTGKNMPQVAFFCDNITKDITDGTNGLYLSNGFLNNAGTGGFNSTEYTRFTVFGPSLLSSKNITQNLTARSNDQANAISHGNLADGTNYRYIIGFILRDSDNRILLSAKVINLDTGDAIYNESFTLPTSFTTEMATGKIVAYSKINAETTFSVRLPETGKANANEVDLNGFKSGAQTEIITVGELSVSDYIDTEYGESYTFEYAKTGESKVTVNADTFLLPSAGEYTLYYTVTKDGRSRLHKLIINYLN